MFDFHLHSSLSFDAKDNIEAFAKMARKKNISEICFTEHIEPAHNYDIPWDGWIDLDAYKKEIARVQAIYSDIKIRVGLELGLDVNKADEIAEYVEKTPLDFVIASQHLIEGEDPYYPEYFENKTKYEAEKLYLETLLACLKAYHGKFNVVGHIGYVNHYARKGNYKYTEYPDLLDEILKHTIACGAGIEINTSGYNTNKEPMPTADVVARFHELGGEIITIGSDAHSIYNIGYHINDAIEILKTLNIKYICTFENMKAIFHKI